MFVPGWEQISKLNKEMASRQFFKSGKDTNSSLLILQILVIEYLFNCATGMVLSMALCLFMPVTRQYHIEVADWIELFFDVWAFLDISYTVL